MINLVKSRPRVTRVIAIAISMLAASLEADAQVTRVDVGLHAGSFARQGESRSGTTGAYGGWLSIGVDHFRVAIDVLRSTSLRERGFACADPLCVRSEPSTSEEQNWAFAVAGVWQYGRE